MDAATVLEHVTGAAAGDTIEVRSVTVSHAAAAPFLGSFPTRSHLAKHELPAAAGRAFAELRELVAFDAAADCSLFALLWSLFTKWSRHCSRAKAEAKAKAKAKAKAAAAVGASSSSSAAAAAAAAAAAGAAGAADGGAATATATATAYPISVLAGVFHGMTARKRPRMSAAEEAYCVDVGFRLFDEVGPNVGQLALAAECHDTRTLLAHFPKHDGAGAKASKRHS